MHREVERCVLVPQGEGGEGSMEFNLITLEQVHDGLLFDARAALAQTLCHLNRSDVYCAEVPG